MQAEGFTLSKWSAVQAFFDGSVLLLLFLVLNYAGGEGSALCKSALETGKINVEVACRAPGSLTLIHFRRDPATKWFIVGPAILTFGTVGRRFSVPEIDGFESDPFVGALGGPDAVRKLRDSWSEALRVRK